mmetsp:Transcript_16571/g.29984  ORF Transcript_16571/g.29984 Transcript_16571/m.29984 type:complete len:281 (+) Transcript_16571:736-1578(+)
MRSTAVGIGRSCASRTVEGTCVNNVHQLIRMGYRVLAQPGEANLALAIFETSHRIPGIQKVQQLSAVDFEQGDADGYVGVGGVFGDAEDVLCGKEVKAEIGVGYIGGLVPRSRSCRVGAHHSKGLSTASLSIREHTRPLPPKHPGNQTHHRPFVNLYIVRMLVENVVERERSGLNLLRQIQLGLGLMDKHATVIIVLERLDDVYLGAGSLTGGHRTLAHDDPDTHFIHCIVLVVARCRIPIANDLFVFVIEGLCKLPDLGGPGIVSGGSVDEHCTIVIYW